MPVQGRRVPEVVGSSGQPAGASANRRCSLPGKAGQEKEGVTERPGGRANILRWARRGPLVNGGMKKVRDPRNSAAAKKSRVFRGLEGEGAAKDPLTYPFKNSHQNLLD